MNIFRSGLALEDDNSQDAACFRIFFILGALERLETRTHCRIHELFDCIVACSFEGLLALMLTASTDGETPLWSTAEITELLIHHVHALFCIPHERSEETSFELCLTMLFKDSKYSNVLTRVIVLLKSGKIDTKDAQKEECADYFLKDIACTAIAEGFSANPKEWLKRPRASNRSYDSTALRELYDLHKKRINERNRDEKLSMISFENNERISADQACVQNALSLPSCYARTILPPTPKMSEVLQTKGPDALEKSLKESLKSGQDAMNALLAQDPNTMPIVRNVLDAMSRKKDNSSSA